ncbi:MAG: lysyl oxidase family protein [Planctomycetaceae bacterium]|nr:lysyl oxidase family protein [Planctomycetaceae bacterium]
MLLSRWLTGRAWLLFAGLLGFGLPVGWSAIRAGVGPTPLLPDVIVWADRARHLLYGWTLDRREQPGRVLLRLTTAIPNQGAGPMELVGGETHPDGTQDVYQRIYNDDGTYADVLAGVFVHHPEHNHIHFEGYAVYRLRAVTDEGGVGDVVAEGDKVSFCLIDVLVYDRRLPGFPRTAQYRTCNATRQGVSVGWADVYEKSLPDQWIDVTDVPNGQYWLEVEVDPENRLLESDETNNVTRISIVLRK